MTTTDLAATFDQAAASATTDTAATPSPASVLDPRTLLFGVDPTTGIVSLDVRNDGTATVWRRVEGRVVREDDIYEPWFLARSPDILAPLGASVVPLRRDQPVPLDAKAGYEVLEGDNHYKLLVRTHRIADLHDALVRGYSERNDGLQVEALREMRGEIYIRAHVEQYLISSGRTYFKGLTYDDVVRLQFDLETTDLSPERGRIFMISVRDNKGFERVIDGSSERDLIAELVRIVAERDPDVIENHNIFGFDIPFLIARARKNNVRLALGRNGGEFEDYVDSLKLGAESQRFRRYALVGREIVDTLHAVQRYDAVVRHMRNHTLKNAARYFGVAREDREYIDGPAIAAEYERDPERVRRYALHDVEEVDGLSRALMGASFMLSSMVPRPYDRIATSGTGQGLIEPLMVRVYVAARQSVPRGEGGREYAGGTSALFRSGVFSHVVKADVASLYPSIMLTFDVAPRSDRQLNAMLTILRHLMEQRLLHKAEARRLAPADPQRAYHDALQGAVKILINSFYGSLGNAVNLFADAAAAAEVTRHGRAILLRMLTALEERGMDLIEADTDGVIFGTPDGWTEDQERRLIAEVGETLPAGINIEHDGRWARMYSYMEKNYALLGYDDTLTVKGSSFRSSRNEFYGERFFRAMLPLVMRGRMAEARDLYLETVRQIRAREMPVRDLCVSTKLTKSPDDYQKSGRKEEAYEVMKAAKRTAWAPGDRIAYYQASRGRRKLVEEFADDYDVEHYVRKLTDTYCARLIKAIPPEHFAQLFGEQLPLFATPLDDIVPLVTVETTLAELKGRAS